MRHSEVLLLSPNRQYIQRQNDKHTTLLINGYTALPLSLSQYSPSARLSGSGLSGYSYGYWFRTAAKDECIGGCNEQGASHNVAEGDRDEVGADEVPKSEGCATGNAQRYEEHIGHCTAHTMIGMRTGAVSPVPSCGW